jgi:nitroreductase
MSCINQVLARRSVRKYKSVPVSEEVINNILEAGRLAPSASNNQPWHFIVVRDTEGKDACDYQRFNRWVNGAAFVVVGLYRQSEVVIEKISLMDVTIALQNMVIAGWMQGVGSCWMGAFNETKLKETLNLPVDVKPVGAIAFGIPDENPRQPPKKPINEIFHFDKW